MSTRGLTTRPIGCTLSPARLDPRAQEFAVHYARPDLGPFIFVTLAVLLGLYFTFASIQGDFGLFQRLVIEAEARDLLAERDRLRSEITGLANRTHRMSDDYLDLDMLDEQARSVLGLVRADEIVIP